jgi:thiol-disulfide isomerase/thioredoxin
MNKSFALIFTFLFSSYAFLFANGGYEIKVKITDFDQTEAYLGYHYGDKQYIKDTVQISNDGYLTFRGDEALEGGVYLVILPPENQYFQVLVNPGEQYITVETDAKDLFNNIKVTGSRDNELFYDYTSFLGTKKPEAEKINKEIEAAGENKSEVEKLEKKLEKINIDVRAYQDKIVKDYPNSLTAAIIKSSLEVPIPEFEGEKSDVELKRYLYFKEHYFDNMNMADPRMLRTPILFGKIDYYIEKLTVQHPDSISKSVDRILSLVEPSEETYKFYLIHFLNNYAKSKFVGMDAVYVHLGEKYYCSGKAWWVEEEQLKKICSNVAKLKPILVGKIAPDINVQKKDGSSISLHEVKSDITVLFFWAPDCGHCKKAMPFVVSFYDKYSSWGVEIFAVCTKTGNDMGECWDGIEEKNMGKWINTVDPYLRSKYKQIYDIRTTPRIFVLDKDKKIISKGIGGEQLEEIIENIIFNDAELPLGQTHLSKQILLLKSKDASRAANAAAEILNLALSGQNVEAAINSLNELENDKRSVTENFVINSLNELENDKTGIYSLKPLFSGGPTTLGAIAIKVIDGIRKIQSKSK